jgi:hypothetical protein
MGSGEPIADIRAVAAKAHFVRSAAARLRFEADFV